MSSSGKFGRLGQGNPRIRAAWAAALIGAFVLGALLVGASGPAAAAASGGTPPSMFAPVPSPIAVSATTTALLALSSSSCTTLYSIAADHSVTSYNPIPTNVKKCNEAALAVSPGLGGFPAGEVYVLESDGSVYAIAPSLGSGSLIYSDPANLSGTYLGLAFDYTGAFGYALIATGGKAGNVVAITPHISSSLPASSSAAYSEQYLASFGSYVEGPSVAPSTYGSTYNGDLVVASEGNSNVYTLAPGATSTGSFSTQWKNSEAVSFVPTLACSYSGTGYSYFIADTSDNAVLGIPSSTFAASSNSALILSEYKGVGVDVVSAAGTSTSVLPISGTLDGASYVTCPVGVTQQIDLSSNGLGGSQGTQLDTTMNLIGFDPAGGWLVGTDSQNAPNEAFFVDGASGTLVGEIPVGITASSVAYSPKTNTLYLAGMNSSSDYGSLALLNAVTLQVLGTIPVEQGYAATSVVFNNQNTKLYVAFADGNVDVFSLTNNQFSSSAQQMVPLTGATSLTGMVADPVDGNVYVVGNMGTAGYVWEIHAFSLVGSPLSVGSNAVAVDVNPSSGLLYVAVEGSNEVVFVAPGDVLTGSSVAIPSPVGVAYDNQTGYLFADSSTGSMSIFDGTSLLATFPLGTSPGPLVYDPVNGIVYVCAYVPDPRIILGTSG